MKVFPKSCTLPVRCPPSLSPMNTMHEPSGAPETEASDSSARQSSKVLWRTSSGLGASHESTYTPAPLPAVMRVMVTPLIVSVDAEE